jgi:hypothetical protein
VRATSSSSSADDRLIRAARRPRAQDGDGCLDAILAADADRGVSRRRAGGQGGEPCRTGDGNDDQPEG